MSGLFNKPNTNYINNMVNFIACLAHFCELHGPSTIICTQMTTLQDKSDHLLRNTSKLHSCASCKLILPDDAVNLVTTMDNKNESSTPAVYISTHYPSSQQRYAALTKLIMKSLSVETTTDLSKPIFYGDVVNGYCISKIFKIKDLSSRGSERKYSLMVIADFETKLLQNWDIIATYLNEIISLIQAQVDIVINNAIMKKEASNANGAMFDNERYLRRSLIRPKSLVELTDDDQIFVKFHLWAIELLKDITI